MASVVFGPALYHSKVVSASSNDAGFQTYQNSSVLKTTCSVGGLISNRTTYAETHPYGISLLPITQGANGTSNFNMYGLDIHPIICLSTSTPATVWQNRHFAGGGAGTTCLNIYSGVKPTTTKNFTNLNNYASQLLISFPMGAGISGVKFLTHNLEKASNILLTSTYKNPGEVEVILGISSSKVSPTADGVATWFWFGNCVTPTDLSNSPFVIGTVGNTNDGTYDMYLPDTNIDSSNVYFSGGFRYKFPSVLTV